MAELDRLGWAARQSFKVGDVVVGIRTDSASFAAWLAVTLAAYTTAEKEHDIWFSALLYDDGQVAAVGRRFNFLYASALLVARTTSVATLVKVLFAELESMLFKDRDDAVYAHSALLRWNGRTALVPSGALFWLAGVQRTVRRSGLVLPVSQYTAIDIDSGDVIPPTSALDLPADAADRLADLFPAGEDGARVSLEGPVAVDALVSVGSEDDPVARISKATGVVRVAETVMNLPKLGQDGLDALARMVADAGCYQIPPASPMDTPDVIIRALQMQRPD